MNDKPYVSSRIVAGLFLVLSLGCGAFMGCMSAGSSVPTLGFLEDYAELAPGRPGQASLIYIDAEADFSDYSAIDVEPVIAWPEGEGAASTASLHLAKKLEEGLRRELAREFTIVEQPGPGSLQLRSALRAGDDSEVTLEVELLDGKTGRRVVAAVDRRALEPDASPPQTDAWAILIRNRLASFRQFDAAAKSRSR